MAAPALVGRDDAIGVVEARLRDTAERGGALVIRGAAGIGKTSLLETAVNDARSRNLMVLATAGVESETHLPYAGLHQLLRPVLGRADSLPRPQRDALLTAFGMLDGPAPELFLVGLAVLTLLTEAAAEEPLVLIADDAHWFDAPTAAVLAFVARRLEADPVLLLAVIRDGFETPLLGLGLAELRLEPLDPDASAQLLDAHAPDLAAATRARVLREAAGNPLALLELPRALRSRPHASGQALPPILPLTDRLQTAFAARAAQLPIETRTALLVAAADDRADASEVLAATAHVIGSTATVEILELAAAAALITVDETSVRFRHPLVRSALYHSASLGQRHAAHRALAEVLAEEPDRRAWHRAAAIVGTDEGAAAELEAAARRARDRGATTVAIAAQERAASLTADPTMRARRGLDAAELASSSASRRSSPACSRTPSEWSSGRAIAPGRSGCARSSVMACPAMPAASAGWSGVRRRRSRRATPSWR